MKIGGDYRVHPYRNTWPAAAGDLGLDPEAVIERVDALAVATADAFRDAAASPDVASLGRPLPARLIDLVAERVERCRDLLRPAARRT
jgi:hypothetical protein